MPLKIGWSADILVPSGPQLKLKRTIDVDAYDAIKIEVPAGTTNKSVELQPGGPGRVKFLAVTASRYKDLTFKVNSSGSGATEVVLDEPQVFVGDGSVGLLDPSPKKFFFSNASATADAAVEILVGRNATT